MCSIDGLFKRGRRTPTHAAQSRIVNTRTRWHVYASVTQQHARSHMDNTGAFIYMCVCVCVCLDLCAASCTYRPTYTRAHDVTGRIVSTRNRTHVCMEAMQPHARSHLHTRRSICLYFTYISDPSVHGDICKHTHARAHRH